MLPSPKRRVISKRSLSDLPSEIILQVFCFLPLKGGHFSFALTCRRFYDLSEHWSVWKTLAFSLVSPPSFQGIEGADITPKRLSHSRVQMLRESPRVLEHLFARFENNWKSVCKFFGPDASFWAPWARLAYFPSFGDPLPDTDDTIRRTKVGGTPFLSVAESWPTCPVCARGMSFYIQMNTAEGDPGHIASPIIGRDSLAQVFACLSEECDSFELEEKCCARIIPNVSEKQAQSVESLASRVQENLFAPRGELSFVPKVEFPIRCNDPVFEANLCDFQDGTQAQIHHDSRAPSPGDGVKVFGWPSLFDDLALGCCDQDMKMIFQLQNEDHFEVTYGDGNAHLYFCEDCRKPKLEICSYAD